MSSERFVEFLRQNHALGDNDDYTNLPKIAAQSNDANGMNRQQCKACGGDLHACVVSLHAKAGKTSELPYLNCCCRKMFSL